MEDKQAQQILSVAQSVCNEIDEAANATRALFVDEGVGICVKVSEKMWKDRPLMERLSERIMAIKGVSAVYVDIS